MTLQDRRIEAASVGGHVESSRVREGYLVVLISFRNRGKMNEGRKALVAKGWHVVTNGVDATASVKV